MNSIPTVKNVKRATGHELKRAGVALLIGFLVFGGLWLLGALQ